MGGFGRTSQRLLAFIFHLHLEALSGKLNLIRLTAILVGLDDTTRKYFVGLTRDDEAKAASRADLPFGISGQGCDGTPIDFVGDVRDGDLALRCMLTCLNAV